MSKDLWEAAQQAPPGAKYIEKTVAYVVPAPLTNKEQEEETQPARDTAQGVHSIQNSIPMHYWPETDSYVPENAQGVEDAPSAESKIDKNKRLKLGHIKLPEMKPVHCLEAGEGADEFLSQEMLLRVAKTLTADLKLVVRTILKLDTCEFLRSDLTRALKNKWKAKKIKDVLQQLVSKGLLKQLPTQAITGTKGGRPKTEQYQLLFDRDTIPLTVLETEY